MAREEKLGLEIKDIFEKEHGCKFLEGTLPRGFGESRRFIEQLGRLYSREAAAGELVSRYAAAYEKELEELRKDFEGKRVMIFKNSPVPWLEDLVTGLGLDVIWSFQPKESEKKDPEWRHRFSADWKKDVEDFGKKIEELGPDLVLTTDTAVLAEADKVKSCKGVFVGRNIGVGFLSGIDEAKKWLEGSVKELSGRWKNDRAVFEKYYS